MGIILMNYGEAAYEHEGLVGRLMPDGMVTSSWTAETNTAITDQLVAKCSCGWVSDRRWTTDARSPAEMPSIWLKTEILAIWESQHAVPTLDRVAESVRRQVAGDLRDLAGMIEAGRPTRELWRAFHAIDERMRGLPDPIRAVREARPET